MVRKLMREKGLEDVELYVDTLQNAVVHCLDDSWDPRDGLGDGAQGNEALEGAEGNGDNFGNFRSMKTGRRRCSVCHSSVVIKSESGLLAGISERDHLG
jgi:hypothetical protein